MHCSRKNRLERSKAALPGTATVMEPLQASLRNPGRIRAVRCSADLLRAVVVAGQAVAIRCRVCLPANLEPLQALRLCICIT